ncbi:MAG: right-handed parallel beta-helix repeat-containing protein [Actinomycetota bacterium]
MKKLALLTGVVVVLGTLVAAPGAVAGTQIVVDDDAAECPNADTTSIQDAVDLAEPGTSIKVCPGTYQEQVRIPAGKDGLKLFSLTPRSAVIKAPATMLPTDSGDIVQIDGAEDIGLRHFTITGPLPDQLFCSVELRTGVRVIGGGSAKLFGNHITEIRSASPALRGCQNGFGVAVGRQFQGQFGSATITNNLIDNYQKGGVYVDGEESSGRVDHNEIVGTGPDPAIAQNGIQVSRGAQVRVDHNRVSANQYSLAEVNGFEASGIILFEPGAVDVLHNEVFENDNAVVLLSSVGTIVGHNDVWDNVFDGIQASDSSAGVIEHNDVAGSGRDGIYFDADTSDNLIRMNRAFDNVEHDAHDDSTGDGTAGTANEWIKNHCETANRPGLCRS